MESSTLHDGDCLLDGKYKITQVLGQGGFGITYEAEQVSLGRKVAIKEFFMKDICNRDMQTSHISVPSVGSKELVEKFKQKFIKEAKMIAGFDNEHIVRIHDVFEENGTAYYVMEYLGGGSLLELVKSKGSLRESAAVGYVRQIANALSYLHEQNTLHLDVKPANILLSQKGQLKLIDFGISKHYDEAGSQTSSSPVGISKGFAPLEQYQQGGDVSKFTPATDIYALGATLYYLVTGTVPPDASEVNEEGLPTLPSKLSDNLKDAITKAMSPRKKDRPQSVEAFLALLDSTRIGIILETKGVDKIRVEETVIIDAPKPTPEPIPDTVTSSEPIPDSAPKRKFPKWLWGVVSAIVAIILCIIFWPKTKGKTLELPAQQVKEIIEQNIEQIESESGQIPLNNQKIETPVLTKSKPSDGTTPVSKPATPMVHKSSVEDPIPIVPTEELNTVDDDVTVDDVVINEENDAPLEFNTSYTAEVKVEEEEEVEEALPFQLVEQAPKFNGGGPNEFSKWVNEHLEYPEIAKQNGIQGRVMLSFKIGKNGKLTDVKVIRGVDPSLDQEAMRVVKMSPQWTPGKQRDKAVPVSYTFPVIFQLR